MNSSSIAQGSTTPKKAKASSTLVNNGRLKVSTNKTNKNPNNNKNDDSDQSINNSNNSNNKSTTSSKNKNNSTEVHTIKRKSNDNKNISIFYRPVKRKPPYKPSEVDFHIGVDFESFGKEAPKHSLVGGRDPNSRLQSQLSSTSPDNPSPCDYNPVLIPSMISPSPYRHYMSRASSSLHGPILVEGEMSKESNLKIDYLDPEVYKTLQTQGNLKSTIGTVDHAPKFYSDLMQTATSVPGCTFIPSRELSLNGQGVKIGTKKPTNYETQNPGPGEYRPELKMNSLLSRAPMHQLSGPQFRFDWLEDKRGVPSPSQYNPQKLETSSPQFSIGIKSRINKNNHQKRINISEESTRIALHNAESREVVTAPSRNRSRYRKNVNDFDKSCNYYIPNESNKKRPKSRSISSALSTSAYYNERLNNTSSASRREREKVEPGSSNYSSFESFSKKVEKESVYSSFYSKCVNVNSNQKNVIAFPVGQFIMKLDVSVVPLQEARKYIAKHQELVAWVEFILDQVMYEKPEEPLLLIREVFMEIKKNDAQKDSIYFDDDYNLNQVLVHMKEKTTDFVY